MPRGRVSKGAMVIVGPWMYPWYHQSCADALEALGWRVTPFSWLLDFFRPAGNLDYAYRSFFARVQNRLLAGPALSAVNRRLLDLVRAIQPRVVWFYNCTHIYPETVRALRRADGSALLVQYANDNPFGRHVRPDYWRHLKRAIPDFDRHFVYRHSNIREFHAAGAKCVALLRSYFVPSLDHRVLLGSEHARFVADVVFAGHFERDGRDQHLLAVAEGGHRLNLFGGGWNRAPKDVLRVLRGARTAVEGVYGDDYCRAICGAKIALSFLSGLNRDTYTRRNFQIPAMGTFMLSQYSEDLASLFREGEEAEFFRDRDELLDKISFYLVHDNARERVAAAGHARVLRDGHDVGSRMREFDRAVDHA